MQQQPQVDDVLLAPLGFIWHYAKTSLLCMKRYYDPKNMKILLNESKDDFFVLKTIKMWKTKITVL